MALPNPKWRGDLRKTRGVAGATGGCSSPQGAHRNGVAFSLVEQLNWDADPLAEAGRHRGRAFGREGTRGEASGYTDGQTVG
jgi:hypothetical protein